MFNLIMTIHIIACLLLIFMILIQSGRSSGLVESFSFAESILGTKTPKMLTRFTVILASVFILTCVGLSFLTYQRSKSLIEQKAIKPKKEKIVSEKPKTEVPAVVDIQKETPSAEKPEEANTLPAETK